MLLLIGGLSGAGKTELGRFLQANCGFRWVELDGGEQNKDMVDEIIGMNRQYAWQHNCR
jgi:predicted kinase